MCCRSAASRRSSSRPNGPAYGTSSCRCDCKQQVDEDLTPDQVEGVNIHYARRIEDVLAVALPKGVAEVIQDEEVREEVLSAAA